MTTKRNYRASSHPQADLFGAMESGPKRPEKPIANFKRIGEGVRGPCPFDESDHPRLTEEEAEDLVIALEHQKNGTRSWDYIRALRELNGWRSGFYTRVS
jgi:hypothetical protein